MEAAPLQYLIPEDRIEGLVAALEGGLSVLEEPETPVVSTLLDTTDRRLAAAGLRLHEESGTQGRRLVFTEPDLPRPLSLPAPAPRFLRDLPLSRLRTRLEPVVDDRALLPRVQVEGRSRTFRVLDEIEKTVLWVRIDRSRARDPLSGEDHPLADRLWLIPVRGYPEPLARAQALLTEFELPIAPKTALEEALDRLDEATPAGQNLPSAPSPFAFTADDDAGSVLRGMLLHWITRFQRDLPGVKADLDPQFLGDALEALDHTLLLCDRLGEWIGNEPAFLENALWLHQNLDAAADAGRFLGHLDRRQHRFAPRFRQGLAGAQAFLSRRQLDHHRLLVRTLNGPRARRFFNAFHAFLTSDGAPQVAASISTAARRGIWRAFKDVLKTGRRLRPRSAPAEVELMHRHTQDLLLLMETLAPVFDPPALQPLLGLVREVAQLTQALVAPDTQGARMLELIQDARTEDPADIDALLVIGMLAEDLHTRRNRAWLRLASRFEDLSAKPSIHAFQKLLVRPAR